VFESLFNMHYDTARINCDRVYVTIGCPSVCLSIRPSIYLVCMSVPCCAAAAACGGFAAVGPAGRRYGSISARRVCSRHDHLYIHSSTVVGSKCEQCHVYIHRKLNTDLCYMGSCCLNVKAVNDWMSGDACGRRAKIHQVSHCGRGWATWTHWVSCLPQ